MDLIILIFSVFLIYSLLNKVFFSQGLAFVLNMMVGIIGLYFCGFRFLMKDICLWSKQYFFFGYKV
ncbi:hypothetical protein A7P53_04660 [Acinetobacter defluvii]|nr:hypothetical protein [Acinetobacter defluvii]